MGCFFFNNCQRQCQPCPPRPCPPGPYPPGPYPPPHPPKPNPPRYPSAISTRDTTTQTLSTTYVSLKHGDTIYQSGYEFTNVAPGTMTIREAGVYKANYSVIAKATFDAAGNDDIAIHASLGGTLSTIPGSETTTTLTTEAAGTVTEMTNKEFTFTVAEDMVPVTINLQAGILESQTSTAAEINTVALTIVRVG